MTQPTYPLLFGDTVTPSTGNHQPSTSNHQPSTSNHQPSTINQQPATSNLQPTTSNKKFLNLTFPYTHDAIHPKIPEGDKYQ